MIAADGRFQPAIDRHRLMALLPGPVACLVPAYFEVTAWPLLPAWTETPLDMHFSIVMPWRFMIALLGYGRRFLRSSNQFVAYADEASCPVYLLHQTVILMAGFVVVHWPGGVAVKFATIVVVSPLTSVLVYELVVGRVGAVRFLFGMKPARRASRVAEAR